MSRLAQEVTRAVAALTRQAKRTERDMDEQDDQNAGDTFSGDAYEDQADQLGDAGPAPAVSEQSGETGEDEMAKKKAKSTRKKVSTPRARKPATAKRERREKFTGLPTVDDMRLAPNGVTARGPQRLRVDFANGFSVTLLPMSGPKDQWPQVRDLMVTWLTKRLSA